MKTTTGKWYNLPQRIKTPLGQAVVRVRKLKPEHSKALASVYESIAVSITEEIVSVQGVTAKGCKITEGSHYAASVNGRAKPPANKKAQGEYRRLKAAKIGDGIGRPGRSGSKAYHKAKHAGR